MQTFLYGHCNVGVFKTNRVGNYGDIKSCLGRNGIENIFSVIVLKRLGYYITYDSYDGYQEVSKGYVSVKFYQYDQGLTYINANKQGVLLVQTAWQKYEGYTKNQL